MRPETFEASAQDSFMAVEIVFLSRRVAVGGAYRITSGAHDLVRLTARPLARDSGPVANCNEYRDDWILVENESWRWRILHMVVHSLQSIILTGAAAVVDSSTYTTPTVQCSPENRSY